MRLFGFEIRRIPEALDPLEAMKQACDQMNEAWSTHQSEGGKIRPWVEWEEKRVILTQWKVGRPEIFHE